MLMVTLMEPLYSTVFFFCFLFVFKGLALFNTSVTKVIFNTTLNVLNH